MFLKLLIVAKYITDGGKYNPEGYAIKLPYASGEKYTISYNLDGGVEKSNIKTYAQVSLPYTLNTMYFLDGQEVMEIHHKLK